MEMAFSVEKPFNELPDLPPKEDLETPRILKTAIEANREYVENIKFFDTKLEHVD
jgi:hypothetical protein